MNDNVNDERDAMWFDNTGLIRTGVLVAAILIALLYSRSCFGANAAAPLAAVPAAGPAALVLDGINVGEDGQTVEFFGTGEPGQTARVFVNSALVGSAPIGADGSWRAQFNGLFSPDNYDAYAEYFEIDGRSAARSFIVPAAAITLVKPQFDSWLDGSETEIGRRLTITGNGTPNATHVLYLNGQEAGRAIADENGKFLFVINDAPEGDWEASVVALGNGTDQLESDSIALRVVPAAPVVVVEEEAAPAFDIAITDTVVGENSDSAITVSGTGTPGATVAIFVDGVQVHSAVIGDDGTWSFSGIVAPGTHSIEAQLFDNADGDTSGEAVAIAEAVSFDVVAARENNTTHSGRSGLFRILFGAPVGDGSGTNDDGSAAADEAAGAPAVELIVDASWSMTLPLTSNEEEDRLTADNPDSRIAIAQEAMVNLIEETLPEGAPVAVRAFGNLEGNLACRTDLMSALQPLDRESLANVVNGIDPQFNANTAIGAALRQVPNDLAGTDREKIVVLLTDGQETCGEDPAAIIQDLAAQGIDVSLNVIGFAILDEGLKAQFAEWAELGNGAFYDASDADLLGVALERAMTVGYTVQDTDGNFVQRGVVGGRYLELEPGVYNILNRQGEIVYENVIVTPNSVSTLLGG